MSRFDNFKKLEDCAEALAQVDAIINNGGVAEVKTEHGNIVVVEISRKLRYIDKKQS